MFSAHTFIDMLQNSKRTLTNKLIKDETLNKAAHNFIDAQTTFAKMLAKNTEDISKHFFDTQTSSLFPDTKSKKP
jgi:hypothetical protein